MMSKKKPIPSNGKKIPAKIKFDYLKSSLFRVIHADGVWGGVTPRGQIQMTFWNERAAIPTQMTYEASDDGKVGDEIKAERQSRDAIVREVEALVILDLVTAKSVLKWLQARIEFAEAMRKEPPEPGEEQQSGDREGK